MSSEIKRRNTQQRQIILNIIKSTNTHPTADWIYQKAREYIPNISLGTVYRNIKVLKEEGLIKELSDGKLARFDGRIDKHFHFKCISCGNIYDIEADDIKFSDNLKDKGFLILEYEISMSGICKSCLEKKKNKGNED
jgi:Fur family ferric uptake transcriptional regulator/Fur family peroxide stress response transcriptional regulator